VTPYEILQAMTVAWGGQFIKVTKESFRELRDRPGISEAPFTSNVLGVNYRKRIVYHSDNPEPGELIHEMGHIFASRKNTTWAEEFAFFGWEYRLAIHAGCVDNWLKNTGRYNIRVAGRLEEFGDLSEEDRQSVLRKRVAYGQRTGRIDSDGNPLSLRTPLKRKQTL
jgi:hypothetical protein